jgi:hypothetical protein
MNRGRYRNRGGISRGRGGNTSSSARPLKGLFADGIWQCNCTPRLPAEHFKVKKEGKNQGRWFYTCQNSEPKRCDFFLWDEDAKPREEAAVLSGKRTEPAGLGSDEVQEGWNAGRAQRAARTDGMGARGGGVTGRGLFAPREEAANGGRVREDDETDSPSPRPLSPPPPFSSAQQPASSGVKRTAQQAGMNDDDEEEFFPWPLTGQEEQELAKNADNRTLETPHKALKTGVYATPATTGKRRLPWLDKDQAPKTPATASKVSTEYFDSPSTRSRTLSAAADNHNIPQAITPQPPYTAATTNATTPTPPTRHKDALHNPADSESTLTASALSILAPITIPQNTMDALRSLLTKHDLKLQGTIKGRDISRLAIKAKDARIAELEAKIAGVENGRIAELSARVRSLEAEREVDRGVVRQLRWELGNAGGGSQETIG